MAANELNLNDILNRLEAVNTKYQDHINRSNAFHGTVQSINPIPSSNQYKHALLTEQKQGCVNRMAGHIAQAKWANNQEGKETYVIDNLMDMKKVLEERQENLKEVRGTSFVRQVGDFFTKEEKNRGKSDGSIYFDDMKSWLDKAEEHVGKEPRFSDSIQERTGINPQMFRM